MPLPKFSVGEIVIRQAETYVEKNGEYEVEDIITKSEMAELIPSMSVVGDFYYKLKGFCVEITLISTGEKTGDLSYHSSEIWLRKKHQPGEMNFTSLMESLKSPVVA